MNYDEVTGKEIDTKRRNKSGCCMSAVICRIFLQLSAPTYGIPLRTLGLLNGALILGLLFGWYRCLQLFDRQYSRSASVALCVVTLMTCTTSRGPFRESAPPRRTTIASSELVLNRAVYDDRDLLDLPLTRLSQHSWLYPGQSGDSVRVN